MDLNPASLKDEVFDLKNRVKNKIKETQRVLKITEKPDREEFEMSAKITGVGMLIIGAMVFVFYLASNLIPQYL